MKEGSLGIQQMHCWTHVQDALLRGNVKAKSETKKKKVGSRKPVLGKKKKTKVQNKTKQNKTRTLRQRIPAERLLLPQHPPQRRYETKDESGIRVGSRPQGV